MNKMTYKGYAARIEYSDEDGLFVGHIAGIRAELAHKSINQWVTDVLSREAHAER